MKRRWLIAVMPLFIAGCGYNKIQTLDEQASAAQGNAAAGTMAGAAGKVADPSLRSR